MSVLTVLIVANLLLGATAYLVMLERKIASWVQDRVGPNRTGFGFGFGLFKDFHFWGLGQPAADGIKLVMKEDYTPPSVERSLFVLAPILGVIPALIVWAIIPWGGVWDFPGINLAGTQWVNPGQVVVSALNVDIGVIYVLAVGSLGVYGVVLAGYASNNKYAFLGGLRATAQMLSYEIPLGLGVLIILLMSGTLRPDLIVALQAQGMWNIFYQPMLAIIAFSCMLAEANRAPFDLAEAEQELVAGFHTEYSSMKFALFFLGEYIHVVGGAAFFTLMFLGGYDIPIWSGSQTGGMLGGLLWVMINAGVFFSKVFVVICLVMIIRWTLPRFRFDQLMRLAWRGLIPMALSLLLLTGFLQYLMVQGTITRGTSHLLMLVGNLALMVIAALLSRLMPEGAPGNRKVGLPGSRFSPVTNS
ncbi:MAG: NADH-quinone oxidoreductase subunit H [Phycisphaerales bacterium]|nr:NADH-quinone oxidoreductase subunit H [Phycisphaerales bacterium]